MKEYQWKIEGMPFPYSVSGKTKYKLSFISRMWGKKVFVQNATNRHVFDRPAGKWWLKSKLESHLCLLTKVYCGYNSVALHLIQFLVSGQKTTNLLK